MFWLKNMDPSVLNFASMHTFSVGNALEQKTVGLTSQVQDVTFSPNFQINCTPRNQMFQKLEGTSLSDPT